MEALSEDMLGDPQSTAEHVAAHVGLSSILQGETGVDYNPKSSPFSHIGRLSEKAPYTDAFPEESDKAAALSELNKMKNKTVTSIKDGAKNLFGYGGEISSANKSTTNFHDLYDHTSNMSVEPDVLRSHLANQLSPISDHAPNTTIALSSLGSLASELLNNSKPNLAKGAPLDGEKEANQMQISRFNRAAQLVDSPVSIYKNVKDGTLTSKHVEAMQKVYPSLLNSIRSEVMTNLTKYQSEEKKPLSYGMRMSLSRLFNEPMDSTIRSIGKNQLLFANMSGQQAAQEMQQQKTTKSSKSGISKMKLAQADQTKAQQSLQRTSK